MRRCPRCGGGPGDPSCGKTIHDSLEDLEDTTQIEIDVEGRGHKEIAMWLMNQLREMRDRTGLTYEAAWDDGTPMEGCEDVVVNIRIREA